MGATAASGALLDDSSELEKRPSGVVWPVVGGPFTGPGEEGELGPEDVVSDCD
jgi:hypothetical protein